MPGLKVWPFAEFDGKEWLVEVATAWTEQHKLAPGTAAHRTNKEVVIAASDGFLSICAYEIDPDFAAEHSKKTQKTRITTAAILQLS